MSKEGMVKLDKQQQLRLDELRKSLEVRFNRQLSQKLLDQQQQILEMEQQLKTQDE